MRRTIVAFTAALLFMAAPNAQASTRGDLSHAAKQLRHKVVMKFGQKAAGRDIVKYGVVFVTSAHTEAVRRPKLRELRKYKNQLNLIARPAPQFTRRTVGPPSQPPAGVQTPSVKATLPTCTWMPESGGDYNAYNSSSGARGKYQVIPSTHAAHCSDLGWSPGEQEECAARVFKAQGAGAWVNC